MTKILDVLAPNFFAGRAPEFLEWDYKIQLDFDHVAKFEGDRWRDRAERVAKKSYTSRVKHKPVPELELTFRAA